MAIYSVNTASLEAFLPTAFGGSRGDISDGLTHSQQRIAT